MAEQDRVLASLRVWVATAWADGTLAEAESEALRRLIGYAAIPEASKAEALTWLDAPVELDVGQLPELSAVRKLFIYRVAAALTRVDLELDSTERSLLHKLRRALDIDEAEAGEIELGVRARRDS
ncbi:hypothetical protein [Enhygromyxa salina]|nr:hypothetical protein [Enhygromyxa salina]